MTERTQNIAVIGLVAVAVVAILGVVALGYAPGDTESVRVTLGGLSGVAVGALAGMFNRTTLPPSR